MSKKEIYNPYTKNYIKRSNAAIKRINDKCEKEGKVYDPDTGKCVKNTIVSPKNSSMRSPIKSGSPRSDKVEEKIYNPYTKNYIKRSNAAIKRINDKCEKEGKVYDPDTGKCVKKVNTHRKVSPVRSPNKSPNKSPVRSPEKSRVRSPRSDKVEGKIYNPYTKNYIKRSNAAIKRINDKCEKEGKVYDPDVGECVKKMNTHRKVSPVRSPNKSPDLKKRDQKIKYVKEKLREFQPGEYNYETLKEMYELI